MLITPYPSFVFQSDTTDQIAKTFISNPLNKSVYVVDENLRLVGMISLRKLIRHEFKDLIPAEFESFRALEFIGNKSAKDLMYPPIFVYDYDSLKTAFLKMYSNEVDQLPVIDKNKRLLGNIDLLELMTILIEKKERNANKEFLTFIVSRPFSRDYRDYV
jgi:Mg/Co/Ni transporter MgtE